MHFFLWKFGDQLAHTNSILFYAKDQSTVAQQAEMIVDEHFLMSCM